MMGVLVLAVRRGVRQQSPGLGVGRRGRMTVVCM